MAESFSCPCMNIRMLVSTRTSEFPRRPQDPLDVRRVEHHHRPADPDDLPTEEGEGVVPATIAGQLGRLSVPLESFRLDDDLVLDVDEIRVQQETFADPDRQLRDDVEARHQVRLGAEYGLEDVRGLPGCPLSHRDDPRSSATAGAPGQLEQFRLGDVAGVRGEVESLAASPEAPDRTERM